MLQLRKHRTAAIAGSALLAVAAIALLAWRVVWPPLVAPGSIAIVRFRAASASQSEQALALSMAENLKGALNSSGRVDIRDIRSAQISDPLAAGRRIAAEAVLTGTVQVSGARALARVSLLRVADGHTIWAGAFDGPAANWFAMEDRAASKLLDAILREVAIVQHHTADSEADQLYWRGRVGMEERTPEGLIAAGVFFETAARKDRKR